jgi:ferric-dicitrate binding protein FerR (iron transport regulator)
MRRGECHELEVLIDREARGWSEAERLRIEQHLADCADCREALAASRFVRATLRSAQGGLSELGRERALKRAFAAAAQAPARSAGAARQIWAGSLVTLSAAAAALLVWWNVGGDAARAPQALREPAGPAVADRFVVAEQLAPAVDAGERASDTAAELAAAPAWIEAGTKQRHQFGHASVQLARATRARFEQASSTLVLASGRVEVDVDVGRGQPFRVATQHFRVEVLGTRFAVTPRSVVVMRGHVQVFALDGRVLASDLAAGSEFSYDARGSVREQADAGSSGAQQVGAQALPPAESASSLLARARQALAQGELERALELVGRAEASVAGRGERAEAGTLRAEAALLGKQPARAVELYAAVAQQFADLPAGENAAFAAARFAARSVPARERELLERYLAQYPQGRFLDEAKRRLARLPDP